MRKEIKRYISVVFLAALLAMMLIPRWVEKRACKQFGEPLFSHALPADTTLVKKDAARDTEGGTMAAMLLKTELSGEELVAFYSDVTYPPAQEGQTVTLDVMDLDESSIETLKEAKYYEEGASYQFVYLYSK